MAAHSYGAAGMKHAFRTQVRGTRINDCLESAKRGLLSIYTNRRDPLHALFVPGNTKTTRFAIGHVPLDVLHIGATRNITKIAPPIVQLVSANVVNMLLRPRSSHVKKCESMGVIARTKQSYLEVSGAADYPGSIANLDTKACWENPNEQSSFWRVVEVLLNSGGGYFHGKSYTFGGAKCL